MFSMCCAYLIKAWCEVVYIMIYTFVLKGSLIRVLPWRMSVNRCRFLAVPALELTVFWLRYLLWADTRRYDSLVMAYLWLDEAYTVT
jgi:hypothetical protein